MTLPNSFKARQTLTVGDRSYGYYSLAEAEKNAQLAADRVRGQIGAAAGAATVRAQA